MSAVSPARVCFRRVTAALAAVGVVLFGLVPVAAASAAPVAVTITVQEVGGAAISSEHLMVRTDLTGPPATSGSTNASGELSVSLEPGTYFLFATPSSPYAAGVTPIEFTVGDSGPQSFGPYVLDRLPVVKGSVTPALSGTVGIRPYRWNGSGWNLYGGNTYLPDSSGNFEIWFSDSAGAWALEFVPGDADPYRNTFLGGGASLPFDLNDSSTYFELGGLNTTTPVGTTTLLPAGIVSGTVTGGGSPIEDAYVIADDLSGNELAETETDSAGQYTLKVPLDVQFTVRAYHGDWLHEFYPGVQDADDAVKGELTSGDTLWEDVDFVLDPYVEVSFDIVADDGSGPEPYLADVWLYHDDGSGFSPIPFDVEYDESSVWFSELPLGEYRVGLQHAGDARWIPFSTLNTVPGDIVGSIGSECYYQFTVDGDTSYLGFELTVEPDDTSCTLAPWVSGAGTPGVVTGMVANEGDVNGTSIARLYVLDQNDEPIEVVSVPVDSSGAFSLPGVYVDGEYLVGIDTPRDDPHIGQLVGPDDQIALSSLYSTGIDGFDIDGGDSDDIGSVTLPEARVLSGIVTAGGNPMQDICVVLEGAWASLFVMCDVTDSTGRYYLKAPLPADSADPPLEYRIFANSYAFLQTYYGADPDTGDVLSVAFGGYGLDTTDYDIELRVLPSMVIGFASVWDAIEGSLPVTDGIAHLYKRSGSTWVHVEAFPLVHDTNDSQFVFPGELFDLALGPAVDDLDDLPSLTPGDYRVWFAKNGAWLPIAESSQLRLSPAVFGNFIDNHDESCYIDVAGLSSYEIVTVLGAEIDPDSTTNCTPPVLPPTGDGGGDTGGPTAPVPPRFVPPTLDHDPGLDDELDEQGEEPSSAGTPSPTPTPAPTLSPTPSPMPDPSATSGDVEPDLTWLWWGGGILLLLVIGGGTILVLRRP